MNDLLAFFLFFGAVFGLVGIEWAIGVNRKPANRPRAPIAKGCTSDLDEYGAHFMQPPTTQCKPAPSIPTWVNRERVRMGFPPIDESGKHVAADWDVARARRIHIRRNWIINKWQVIVLRGGITIFRSFDTLAETFACAKWWHEHWDDKPCTV